MRRARSIALLALAMAAARCTPDPGLQQDESGSFAVSASAAGGDAGLLIAQNEALERARSFCEDRGKRFKSLADHVAEATFSNDITYTVRFRCPDPGSPDLPRPTENQGTEGRL